MTNAEIFAEATLAADEAVKDKYRTNRFVLGSEVHNYWTAVFDAAAAHLRKHINGQY
jgi:hypothetical protein